MPSGGHNAKPTALRALTGNPGKRPLNEHEPQPEPLHDLAPPPGLDIYGKQAWRQYAPMLQRLGLLTMADVLLLTALCSAHSRWRRATAALHKVRPTDDAYRQLALTVEKAEHSLRLMANEFGMSPASRSRLDVSWRDAPQAEDDVLEGLLSGHSRAS
jgi:P27 family predicted phage terminase small subunit